MSLKSKYKITKVRRVMKLASNDFNAATYEVYKVTGPRKLKKYFTHKKYATDWVKLVTDRTPVA